MTSRGVRKQTIYRDELDYQLFLGLFERVRQRAEWEHLGWCLMPNHFHLIVQTPTESLARGMHMLNGTYARRFNARHAFEGHLFEKRYDARFVEGDDQLEKTVLYVANNPVRAGLCESPSDWPWSSFRDAARNFVFDR